ncbi:alanine racemase [Streptomyces sp. NPDC020983]|uniref:alanine racemase n=1 Tax=Streptomyces sp. NPDC020983 TaxID=3365106 RepID=UPI0037B2DE93
MTHTTSALAARFGTPLYVYRLDRVAAALRDLRAALPQPSRLYYSLKANPHARIAGVLRQGGCHAEVSSQGELAVAREAGFSGAECFYTGPAKSPAEITAALGQGVFRFSVESEADLERVRAAAAQRGARVECLLRVNGGSAGAVGLRMTGGASQFGTEPSQDLLESPSVTGLHFFPGSGARDEDALFTAFLASITQAAQIRRRTPVTDVDLGGGFAAPYARPGDRPRYPTLRRRLEIALDEHLPGWRDGDPVVCFESGRYLTADAGSLVCTVLETKRAGAAEFVLLDSGINHLGGMAGLGRFVRPAALPVGAPPVGTSTATLVGPLCTPADVLGREAPAGTYRSGDTVVFPNVGAYGLTASLIGFLSRPAPLEVVVDEATGAVSASRLELSRREAP